jgi:hypothetical protein
MELVLAAGRRGLLRGQGDAEADAGENGERTGADRAHANLSPWARREVRRSRL